MLTRSILAALLSLSLSACFSGESKGPIAATGSTPAQRIVSLDFCADQYVLRFAKRENILALSIDADKRFSYLRDQARGLGQVRPRAADVLALEPDLIVRSYGGGPEIGPFMEGAGIPVVQIGFPQNIGEVRDEVLRLGTELGQPAKARNVIADMDGRLAQLLEQASDAPRALYMTPGGVTAGDETLIHELMEEAGLENFQEQTGWSPIPLERLAYERPELVVAAFFESEAGDLKNWSAARHPIAQSQLEELPVAAIDGAWTACGGWFLIEAVETMARTRTSTARSEK